MSKKLRFILGLHCHQPVGNFDHVFEHGYQVSYLPLLKTLERFPLVKVAIHYSGPLLEWLSERKPEFFSLVKKLSDRGQVEIMGGGHYEPILPVIPREDSLGQLGYMSWYLKKHFGAQVRGAWLTERIWEPHLPTILSQAGLEYVTVDDFHFRSAGFNIKKLNGYYLSEDEGEVVKIFPISQKLRYLIPFHLVEEVMDFFRYKAETLPDNSCIVLADDGEKFGMWPGTHKWVYEKGWLEKFLTALTENREWLETVTFSEALDNLPASGRVYLPSTSYSEMGGWTLPAEAGERFHKLETRLEKEGRLNEFADFLHGSFWRNFLVKYPEANWMHKRMFWTSRLVHRSLDSRPVSFSRLPESLRQLWRGQCNCAYWHGIFGGLYLPHLRHAVYECLIRAQNLAQTGKQPLIEVDEEDIDRDGHQELRISNQRVNLFIKPSCGGSIIELDDRRTAFNLTDTLARRREAYHYQMESGGPEAGEQGGHATIHDRQFKERISPEEFSYDPYPRNMLREHFFARLPGESRQISHNELPDLGDFADGRWQWNLGRREFSPLVLSLSREGLVRQTSGAEIKIALAKKISLAKDSGKIEVDYRIKNMSEQVLDSFFAVSFNLTVLGPRDPQVGVVLADGSKESLASAALFPPTREITVFNRRDKIDFKLAFSSEPASIVQYPVETISQSESGIDRTYQASCIMPVWPIRLEKSSLWKLKLSLTLISL